MLHTSFWALISAAVHKHSPLSLFTDTHLCHCSQTLTSVTVHRRSPLSMFTDTSVTVHTHLCCCSQTLTSVTVHRHSSLPLFTLTCLCAQTPVPMFTLTHLCHCSQTLTSAAVHRAAKATSAGTVRALHCLGGCPCLLPTPATGHKVTVASKGQTSSVQSGTIQDSVNVQVTWWESGKHVLCGIEVLQCTAVCVLCGIEVLCLTAHSCVSLQHQAGGLPYWVGWPPLLGRVASLTGLVAQLFAADFHHGHWIKLQFWTKFKIVQ